jgi:DNA ligase-1
MQLAHKYKRFVHIPDDCLISEKLDGMRAQWRNGQLVSRNYKPIHAPQWWLDQLPVLPNTQALDGELYVPGLSRQKILSIVRRKTPDMRWEKVHLHCFDLLCPGLDALERYHELSKLVGRRMKIIPMIVGGPLHAETEMARVLANQGEGVMIRFRMNRNTMETHERSHSLLKYKPLRNGTGTIRGYQEGKGRLSGKLGSILLEWNGVQFWINVRGDQFRDEKFYPLGRQVKFEYRETTDAGKPQEARLASPALVD